MKFFYAVSFALYCCLGMRPETKNEVTLNEFTDELVLFCFSFLPATFAARAASVSHRFNSLSGTYLGHLFYSAHDDGTSKPDVCKMYEYYQEVENSNNIHDLIVFTLNSKRPLSLCCESIKMNSIIDYCIESMFPERRPLPAVLRQWGHELDLGLNALMIKYKKVAMCTYRLPTEALIDAAGIQTVQIWMNSQSLKERVFLLSSPEFMNAGFEGRKKLIQLFQADEKKSIHVLIETENVFDSRSLSGEIGEVELVVLAEISKDEKSVERALNLAEEFIRKTTLDELASVLMCIKNTEFLVGILKNRHLAELEHLSLSLVLYMRKDAEIIFRSINDVDAIEASIRYGDENAHIVLKVAFGIITGMEDEALLPIIKSCNQAHCILGRLAAYYKRSPDVLRVLMSRENVYGHYLPPNFHECYCFEYATLDYSLEDNKALLGGKGEIRSWSHYWNFISVPRRLEYLEYMLENADEDEILGVFDMIEQRGRFICTDELFRKFLRRATDSGRTGFDGEVGQSEHLKKEIRKEVRKILRDGLDCSKMFRLDSEWFRLGILQHLVLEELLKLENGLDTIIKYLCKNTGTDSEASVVLLFQICLTNDIGFEMPSQYHPYVFKALSKIMTESNRSNRRSSMVDHLNMTFDSCKSDPIPSSFHEAVAETILSPEYLELVAALDFFRKVFEEY